MKVTLVDPSDYILHEAPRWGLLPPGCRDLLDVINGKATGIGDAETTASEQLSGDLQCLRTLKQLSKALSDEAAQGQLEQIPAHSDPSFSAGTIEIGTTITVKELATRMRSKWFQIIGTLLNLKIFVPNGDHSLTFEEAARVALKYGFTAMRTE